MGLTDTHCHLNHSDFDADCVEAIQRAREAGVTRLLVIGCDLASSRFAVRLAVDNHDVQAAIGIHPESAGEWSPDVREDLVAVVKQSAPNIVAWGEVGLDYYWDSVSKDVQLRAFEEQIEIAKELSLPLIIHCRDAFSDVLDVLDDHNNPAAVLHCFTGSASEASRAIDDGYYIGVGGIATFKKSDSLREIVRALPLDRILLETDSPYLAPQQRRGKRNEPAYVAYVAETLAPQFGLTMLEFANVTSANADRLFGPLPGP